MQTCNFPEPVIQNYKPKDGRDCLLNIIAINKIIQYFIYKIREERPIS